MTRYVRIASAFGPLFAVERDEAIAAIHFEGGRHAPAIAPDWIEDRESRLLRECARQLERYFGGALRDFDLPLAPRGTAFQQQVWRAIAKIPYGATLTYAQLAASAGADGCARAAGAATGRNPLSIVVPCHRVLGSSGSLTGYAGGLDRKARLLRLEGAPVRAAA